MRGLLACLLLIACRGDETVTGYASGTWVLKDLDGTAITTPITLVLDEKKKITGSAPCNSYFADIKAPLPWFELGPIGATRRACPKLALEAQYFATLAEITLAEVTGDTLLLSDDTGPRLIFKATP